MEEQPKRDLGFWKRERLRKYEKGVIPPRLYDPKERRHDYLPYLNEMSYQDYIFCPHWRVVSKFHLSRAGNVCEGCNAFSYTLEVKHVNFKRVGRECIGDIIALCPKCIAERSNREREREQSIIDGIGALEDNALRSVPAYRSLGQDPQSRAQARRLPMSGVQRQGQYTRHPKGFRRSKAGSASSDVC